MLLFALSQVGSRQVCKTHRSSEADFARHGLQRLVKKHRKGTWSARLSASLQMHRARGVGGMAQTLGACWGKWYQTPTRLPCPPLGSVLCAATVQM